jgi:myo-inositol 2-dehydrogenase/D-chiro-inositol 1-dehydrogenase
MITGHVIQTKTKSRAPCGTLALERSNGRFVNTRTHVTAPVGLAIVGAGRMGVTHMRALAGEPSVRLRAIVDPSEQARASATSASPETPAYADLDAAIAGGGIDAVLIAAPSTLHLALVRECAARGLPMLCEKPCGTTSAEASAAADAADAAGCLLQIGYWRRFAPELAELRERVRSGALGELVLVSCYQWDAEPPTAAFRGTSGGVAVDMGVHEFDQLRWLTGQELGTFETVSQAPKAGGPEGLQLLGALSDGTAAFVSLGQSFPHGDCVWVEVFGTAGYERCEVLWGAGGDAALHRALRAQARAFAARVAGGAGGDAATAQDALLTLRAAERIHPG